MQKFSLLVVLEDPGNGESGMGGFFYAHAIFFLFIILFYLVFITSKVTSCE